MDTVRAQYEQWVYPLPGHDLEQDLQEGYFDVSDPSLFRRKLWPKPIEPQNLNILIAGCGTMQAARVAYRNRDCQVVGVDLSQSSLDHEGLLKEKHRLANLRLERLGILDIETLGEQFDLIISTGVLHHLPDPDAGLRKLKAVLAPHGVLSIMVYGFYPRFGVYMMQKAFRLLGVEQTPEGVALVRETVKALPQWHHVKGFARSAEDMSYDAGVVDLFLHPQDRAYTVPQVLSYARDNGLRFQDWVDRQPYSVSAQIDRALPIYEGAARLPPEKQWQLLEILSQTMDRHNFLLCHPEREPDTYTINFSGEEDGAWLQYVPQLRWPMDVRNLQGGFLSFALDRRPPLEAVRPDEKTPITFRRYRHVFTVPAHEVSLFVRVDGKTTIAEIIQKAVSTDESIEATRGRAFRFFSLMHEWDHILYEI